MNNRKESWFGPTMFAGIPLIAMWQKENILPLIWFIVAMVIMIVAYRVLSNFFPIHTSYPMWMAQLIAGTVPFLFYSNDIIDIGTFSVIMFSLCGASAITKIAIEYSGFFPYHLKNR